MGGFVVGDPIKNHPHVPLLPRVQGITSSIDDLYLRGDKLVDRVDRALVNGKLIRAIGGASHLEVEIDDKNGQVLNSDLLEENYVLKLDGLGFVFVKYSRPETNGLLGLTHEAEVVWRLRQLMGPHKAFRDQVTRAEFARARVMELKAPRPRFVCPELHKVEPVKSDREARHRKQESAEERGHGLGDGAHLETKEGEKASPAQIELGDMALRIAESYEAPPVVMVALIAALIDETLMGKLSANVLEAEGSGIGAEVAGAAKEIVNFLTGKGGYPAGGAIAYANHNPGAGAAQIATAMQNNAAGAAPYEQCVPSARQWVAAFGGGSITGQRPERFAFEQKKHEDNWRCITGLAKTVNWRCFESAGWVYFIAELDLLRSMSRMSISDSTPGVLNTSVKGDEGKPQEEVEVEVLSSEWGAPPGSAVSLTRHGPSDGIYIVDRIESPLASRIAPCQVQLKRPTKAKKEPAPQTRSVTAHFGSGEADERANPNAPEAIQRMIEEVDATDGTFHYVWGGGHGSVSELHKRLKGYDCSGYVSHILAAAGLLGTPEDSTALESFGVPGEGEYCTIYANAEHTFGKLLTADGWRYFQSGGQDNSTGWVAKGNQDDTGRFVARHPKGM